MPETLVLFALTALLSEDQCALDDLLRHVCNEFVSISQRLVTFKKM
jgi:hypothetical protein